MKDITITGRAIGDQHAGVVGYIEDPELLRQCAASGQMDAFEMVAQGAVQRGHLSRCAPARPAGFIKPDTDLQVFFYEQDLYVLSNFSAFNLEWQGITFPTSEHAYQWEKFATEADDDTRNGVAYAIMNAPSAHEAFKIAESQKRLRRPDWDAVKVDIMRCILIAKVDQHEYVRRKLLATGDRELVEDSWRDDFWGWGPNRDGQNMLGTLWMKVRNQLRYEGDGGVLEGTNRTTSGVIGQP